jgi:hypothetical protein
MYDPMRLRSARWRKLQHDLAKLPANGSSAPVMQGPVVARNQALAALGTSWLARSLAATPVAGYISGQTGSAVAPSIDYATS